MPTLVTWNVASLNALLRNAPGLLQQIIDDHSIDVICLQETKLQQKGVEDADHRLSLPDWYKYHAVSTDRLGHSGTLILCKQEPLSVKVGIKSAALDRGGRAVTVEFDDFYVVNVYVMNSGSHLINLSTRLNAWDPALSRFVTSLQRKKPVVLCGDLNVAISEVDVYDPRRMIRAAGFTVEERGSFNKFYLNKGWCDAFRETHSATERGYTFYSKRGFMRPKGLGWRLDYFLLSPEFRSTSVNMSCNVLEEYPDVSDHLPLKLKLVLA